MLSYSRLTVLIIVGLLGSFFAGAFARVYFMSTPEIAVKKLQGCSRLPSVRYISVVESEVKSLYLGVDELRVPYNPFANCIEKGAKYVLASIGGPRGGFIHIGEGVVTKLTNHGNVLVQPIEPLYGRVGLLPPFCTNNCSGVIDSLTAPEIEAGTQLILIDVPMNFEPAKYGWKGPIQRIESKDTAMTAILRLASVKGRSFVVMNEGPQSLKEPVFIYFSVLKRRGAKDIWWLHKGSFGLEGRPLLPPSLNAPVSKVDLRTISSVSGAQHVFIGQAPTPQDVAGARIIIPKVPFDKPFEPLPDWNNPIYSSETYFDPASLPTDKNATVLVYGENRLDWRAYYLAKFMVQQGFKKIAWLPGGLDELIMSRLYIE